MHCPDCGTLLKTTPLPACEKCPRCSGEWVELPALALRLRTVAAPGSGSSGAPATTAEPAASRRCPVCRAVLVPRDWAGALAAPPLAACPMGHGAWLPPGHFDGLHEGVARARQLLGAGRGYFTLLARQAALDFERSCRPGRRGVRRRSPLVRFLGTRL